eukprot:TRINITY_DN38572_c0_g1_i1.p1 TRINITY_DN38572_c0_g1~~TRINITY_DN38572_c0_g1_i1.p1  ORF type:complete len:850 (-),score=209.84 TRINITY_DN38572_c0_g1_i1:162-2711(-)
MAPQQQQQRPGGSLQDITMEAIGAFLGDVGLNSLAAAVKSQCGSLTLAAQDAEAFASRLRRLAGKLARLGHQRKGAKGAPEALKRDISDGFAYADQDWAATLQQKIAAAGTSVDTESIIRTQFPKVAAPMAVDTVSSHYVSRQPGGSCQNYDANIVDEYRDDLDPGYRVMELSAAQLTQEQGLSAGPPPAFGSAFGEAPAFGAPPAPAGDDDELMIAASTAPSPARSGRSSRQMSVGISPSPQPSTPLGGRRENPSTSPAVVRSTSNKAASFGFGVVDELLAPSGGSAASTAVPTPQMVATPPAPPHYPMEADVPAFGAAFGDNTAHLGGSQDYMSAPIVGEDDVLLSAAAPGHTRIGLADAAAALSAVEASLELARAEFSFDAETPQPPPQMKQPSPRPPPVEKPVVDELWAPAQASSRTSSRGKAAAAAAAGRRFAYVHKTQPKPPSESSSASRSAKKSSRRSAGVAPCYSEAGDRFYPAESEGVIYDAFPLRVVYERDRTGFEDTKEFPIRVNTIVAARYQVLDYIGSAAFSRAVQCFDLKERRMVCMKIVKNDKDFVDQSLDEIKLLQIIQSGTDSVDDKHCLRLFDYFYHKEHLVIVTELLRDNLYEFARFNRSEAVAMLPASAAAKPYFTLGRMQRITHQVLVALEYVHSLQLIHADLKPENILFKSYASCEVKVIDFGSSCFVDDELSSYVQSRSYRAPEVVLGLPYGQKVDIWSLGCIVAELWAGYVLFQNDSVQSLLARIVGILGAFPSHMLDAGRHVPNFFCQDGRLYKELESGTDEARRIQLLLPKRTSLRQRMRTSDEEFLNFLTQVLQVNPDFRLTAKEALAHPWLARGRYADGLH